jgi:hypothetical protein
VEEQHKEDNRLHDAAERRELTRGLAAERREHSSRKNITTRKAAEDYIPEKEQQKE